MVKGKGSGGKRKKSAKATKKKVSKRPGPQPPVLLAEVGLKSRQYLDLQVEDQRSTIVKLQEKLNKSFADYNALKEAGGTATRQIDDERKYFQIECEKLGEKLRLEQSNAATKVTELETEVKRLENLVDETKLQCNVEVANLTEKLTGMQQKLTDLESYRIEQAHLKVQLRDAESQLQDLEDSHRAEIDRLQRRHVESEAFMYKETELKVARVARAFRSEAADNIDSRTAGALSQSKELKEKANTLNQKLFGVIAANKSLQQKKDTLKRELEIEKQLKDSFANKYRKSQKVVAKLRDELNTAKDRATSREVENENIKEEHARAIAALASELDGMRMVVAATSTQLEGQLSKFSQDGLPEADVGNIGRMLEWVKVTLESCYMKRIKRIGAGNTRARELHALNNEYTRVLHRLNEWAMEANKADVLKRKGSKTKKERQMKWAGGSIANVKSVGTGTEDLKWLSHPPEENGRSALTPETPAIRRTPKMRHKTTPQLQNVLQSNVALSVTTVQAAIHCRDMSESATPAGHLCIVGSDAQGTGWAERVGLQFDDDDKATSTVKSETTVKNDLSLSVC